MKQMLILQQPFLNLRRSQPLFAAAVVVVVLCVVVRSSSCCTVQAFNINHNNNNNNMGYHPYHYRSMYSSFDPNQYSLLQQQQQLTMRHSNIFQPLMMASSTTTPSSSSSSSSSSLPPQLEKSVVVSDQCQLAQLSKMTTISIDSGDIELIRQYAATGYITDATTNPLFVAQTAFKTSSSSSSSTDTDDTKNNIYNQMVNDAVQYAVEKSQSDTTRMTEKDIVALSMDRLAVNLGATIATIPGLTQGYISTEVDPRLSFNINESIQRALRIIEMYENDYHISRDRILIKLAATWEGIMTAKILHEQYNIKCNLTLIFSTVQGITCAQYNLHLISPFPGRILDYYNQKLQRTSVVDPDDDEGVQACTYMYQYFKYYNHTTICMPASWRPSRGSGGTYELDEIQALAGSDRMTIPVPLLAQLIQNKEPLPRKLFPYDHSSTTTTTNAPIIPELLGNGQMTESEFRYLMTMDGCGNDKLAEGIRSFCQLTEQLQVVMTDKVRSYILNETNK